jgi:predicted lysophospholipase L1 biosynthesis ABC-type transport system permease subunit
MVRGRSPNNATFEYRIVGRIVLPKLGDPQALADGAAFTGAGLLRVFDENSSSNRYLVGRYARGVDRAAVERRISALPDLGKPSGPTVAVEVDHLRRIDWFPAILAALLAGLALLAVGHALLTAARRRRRDLALLKTLGFARRQVRATVAWQATTLATVGLVVGIPFGVIVGRVVWSRIADGLGISTAATVPTLALLLAIPAVVALVNLLAFFPARTAANTRPAVVLRSE